MLEAIHAEDVGLLCRLLQQGGPSACNDSVKWRGCDHLAPLHLASRLASVPAIEILLAAGARTDQLDEHGWSCLHHLCISDAHVDSKVHRRSAPSHSEEAG